MQLAGDFDSEFGTGLVTFQYRDKKGGWGQSNQRWLQLRQHGGTFALSQGIT